MPERVDVRRQPRLVVILEAIVVQRGIRARGDHPSALVITQRHLGRAAVAPVIQPALVGIAEMKFALEAAVNVGQALAVETIANQFALSARLLRHALQQPAGIAGDPQRHPAAVPHRA